ncbi:MAG: iron donor protein CyaY [Kofleriaceae bacterium]|jgi:CyaY protein|nr:iron donor protein CyaY [Kofleriaceae bacterium]MBP9166909.1 iron donor protein CyaY [Kofleriaceae bacterium]MBP9861004.1 iron donor protein CyaY [Kofleriaceae bacterium]
MAASVTEKQCYTIAVDADGFDSRAHAELSYLEERLGDLDPDQVEVSTSAGVLRLDLRDGTKVVINSHRAAGQIWMAAVATAWHFDPLDDGRWVARRTDEELRATIARVLRERIGLEVAL